MFTVLQGRFSGRLETKDDERLLADECKHLGTLLGGVGKRGERARTTLAKIIRGIAAGDVRRYLESREVEIEVRSWGHADMVLSGYLLDTPMLGVYT